MGFFSKIKKLWGGGESPSEAEDAVQETTAAQAEIAASEEPAAAQSSADSPLSAESQPVAEAVASAETLGTASYPLAATETAPPVQAPPVAGPAWKTDLLLELRQAEPKLSLWLDITLKGVDGAGELLWERLAFLFESLEAPKDESARFIEKFKTWLEDMGYEALGEFRSELQYRLALALDLEDEEDERSRLMLKLAEGLAKTRESFSKKIDGLLTRHSAVDKAFWDELEEILITGDVGAAASTGLIEDLKDRVRKAGLTDPAGFKDLLKDALEEIFKAKPTIKAHNPPEVVLVIGVNGVGKTTTIAKLAHREVCRGRKVLVAAGDTFRAAAVEQLHLWSKRVGASFYAKGQNADPAAVAFEAMDQALKEGVDLVLVDTAGRLHTKVNLMEELKKIKTVLGKKHPGAPHRSILVIDAGTGQNALSQTKMFSEGIGVDEIILTKLDGTAKGGVAAAVAMQFGVPITFIGLGEKMEDLRPFNGRDFAEALLR